MKYKYHNKTNIMTNLSELKRKNINSSSSCLCKTITQTLCLRLVNTTRLHYLHVVVFFSVLYEKQLHKLMFTPLSPP